MSQRYRITVRGQRAELRGSLTDSFGQLDSLARMVQPLGWMVVASPLREGDKDYLQESEHNRDALGLARDALREIGTKCSNYTEGSCRDPETNRWMNAGNTADRWCDQCIAAYGLGQ